MDTLELLKNINEVCSTAQEGRLSADDLLESAMDGWGGNADDAFQGGFDEGKAEMGSQIQALLQQLVG